MAAGEAARSGRDRAVDRRDALAWTGAVAMFGVGDAVTTMVGLDAGLVEANPAVVAALGHAHPTLAALVAAKSTVIVAAAALWKRAVATQAYLIPASLAIMGALVVAWNTALVVASP
jgi:hypothetical protein